LGERVLPPLDGGGDTIFSPGFSETAFQAIEIGMGQAAVLQSLGESIDSQKFDDGGEYWYYSKHGPRSKSYFIRIVVFDGRGSVVARLAQYYLS
jgi:hypothetical protein